MAHYDLLVLGSGPAGQKAAIQAAKLRKKVVVVEKDQVGGASVNTGTLPSKTLKDAIYHLHGFKLRAFTNVSVSLKKSFTMSDLMARKDRVIKNELEIVTNQLERNDVEIVRGTASFVDPHTIRITKQHGHEEQLSADFIVIATGSRHGASRTFRSTARTSATRTASWAPTRCPRPWPSWAAASSAANTPRCLPPSASR